MLFSLSFQLESRANLTYHCYYDSIECIIAFLLLKMLANKLKSCQILLDNSQSRKRSSIIYSQLFESKISQIIRDDFVDKFWSYFSETIDHNDPHLYKPLLDAISFLSKSCRRIEKLVPGNKELKEKFFFALKTQLLPQRPYYLDEYLQATYLRGFKTYLSLEKSRKNSVDLHGATPMEQDNAENEENDSDECDEIDDYDDCDTTQAKENSCPGCASPCDNCVCESIYSKFCQMNKDLRLLNLLDVLVGDVVMKVSRLFIERRVAAKGKSNYSRSYLAELTVWVHNIVKTWIKQIYGLEGNSKELDSIGQKLDRYLKDAYAEIRVSHMFEIIIEFPNSEAAIQDLKLCLERSNSPNFRLNLIDSVKQSLVESLLHPGVNTYDILTAYISAIKALRALDPTGLILQLVTEPVRRYLKSRSDTVRCIVTALTDEEHNSELNREMIRTRTQTNENGLDGKSGAIEMNLPNEGEKCTATNFEMWKPDPIKLSSTDDVMKSSRFSDIVSILVNIYETKDLFVEEYQKLLSQRLLNKYDECNLDTELRNLELLTLRFSDCELHRCEVMLKDIQTSKRVNKRILSGDIRDQKLTNFKNLDVLIVSSPFWPEKFSPIATLSEEPPVLTLPPEVEEALGIYTKAFEAIQASRSLHWRHHLGSVDMDVTINGKTQNFKVSPLHLAILYLFKEKTSWKLNELISKTSLPGATVRSRLALWQRNGLIREYGDDMYELVVD